MFSFFIFFLSRIIFLYSLLYHKKLEKIPHIYSAPIYLNSTKFVKFRLSLLLFIKHLCLCICFHQVHKKIISSPALPNPYHPFPQIVLFLALWTPQKATKPYKSRFVLNLTIFVRLSNYAPTGIFYR